MTMMTGMTQITKHDTFTANGRHVERGTELTVQRIGRVKFLAHVVTDTTEWLDVRDKKGMVRSVKPGEVRRVHYKKKLGR